MERQILVFAASGKTNKTVNLPNEAKLSDLIPKLEELNIQTDGQRIIVGETENELVSPDSRIPDGDVTIFIMQKKNKGGGIPRAELYAQIKAIVAKDNGAKKYFDDGSNFTRVSSDRLEFLLNKYNNTSKNVKVTAKPVPVVKTTKSSVRVEGENSGDDKTEIERAIHHLENVKNSGRVSLALAGLKAVLDNWGKKEIDTNALEQKASDLARKIQGLEDY